jgi:ATP-dependent helicase/nuclease subunit A
VVTDDRYHIVDYKTSRVTEETVEARAAAYRPQLEAYAVALAQRDTGRDVELTLFFTEVAQPVSWGYDADELDALERSLQRRIHERLAS